MNRTVFFLLGWALWCGGDDNQAQAQATPQEYRLLEGSYLVDECPPCGRPTIQQPLRGKFTLGLLQDAGTYRKYALTNVNFVAGAGSGLERRITGGGIYERFEEFAILQGMRLSLDIKDHYTNKLAFFTNDSRNVFQPFPLIQISLKQTNPAPLQVFSLELFAAPVRELWFSTSRPLTATNPRTNPISGGDLISDTGRAVKRNIDLIGRFGVMPIAPDLGLDAIEMTGHGEILFSISDDVFSETLGPIQHGDLLSSRGAIVKRNQELLAAFRPVSAADAGLDAVQIMPSGEILFSIQSNVVISSAVVLSRGDVLTDRGRIFLTHQQLMANFRPTLTNRDLGLKALRVLPSGEVWFAVEEGFTDNRLGPVQAGDLLSSFGHRVFSNGDLLTAFAPQNPSQDYGLDALYVVTDTQPVRLAPRLVNRGRSNNLIHLEWDGAGAAFQTETSANLEGPWVECSPILPDLSWDVPFDAAIQAAFFRVRQW